MIGVGKKIMGALTESQATQVHGQQHPAGSYSVTFKVTGLLVAPTLS
jgi:hypothetical protein